MKLLYAEDEISMSEAVVDILTYHKYIVDPVYDGQEALDFARAESYDGIILDIMMPKLNGLEVLKTLRAEGNTTPVLLLTAKSEIEDRISGLDCGADDYISKPFSMGEFLARIRAMLRRKDNYTPNILTYEDLSLDSSTYELICNGNSITLPKLEYQLAELLILNNSHFLSSEDILVKIWGYDSESDLGIVWVYISCLRKKITALGSDVTIKVKRNVGYKLEKTQ